MPGTDPRLDKSFNQNLPLGEGGYPARGLFDPLTRLGFPSLQAGYGTLEDIIDSRGQTDPRLLNRTLSDVDRRTQSSEDSFTASLANKNLGNWTGGMGLQAAIRQGGTDKRADVYATNAQQEEQRKRDDLDKLVSLVLQPRMKGKFSEDRGGSQHGAGTNWGAIAGAVASVVAALA